MPFEEAPRPPVPEAADHGRNHTGYYVTRKGIGQPGRLAPWAHPHARQRDPAWGAGVGGHKRCYGPLAARRSV